MQEPRCDFALEKDRGDTDMDGAERRSVELQREAYVVNGGGAVYQAKLLSETGRHNGAKVGPRGNLLPHHLGAGVEERFAARIHYGSIVDERPKRDLGFEIVQKVGVHRQILD